MLSGAAVHAQKKAAPPPPEATYWMSAETLSGMASAGPAGLAHQLELQLGSARRASGAPAAEHLPPAGLRAGNSLPLTTPAAQPRGNSVSRTSYDPSRVKGRMLIYWGCGEHARPGQPLVVDMATLSKNQTAFASMLNVNAMNPPSPDRHATYGEWPNKEGRTTVPATGSLVGDHVVRGNYSPELRFALTAANDFLAPLTPRSTPLPSGAMKVQWPSVPRALAYAAGVMGSAGNDTIVMWSSSEVRLASGVPDYLAPAEVSRLLARKALMAPSATECAVPAEVVKAVKGGMLQMAAYGPEANFASPAAQTPRWVAKLRTKSSHMGMLGMDMPALMRGGGEQERSAGDAPAPAAQSPKRKLLRGLGGLLGIPG